MPRRRKADAKKVLDNTGGAGADVVECVGAMPVLAEAMDRQAVALFPLLFILGKGRAPFYDPYFKELQVLNARAAKGRDFEARIKLVGDGSVDLGALVTHALPYTEPNNAIQMLIDK